MNRLRSQVALVSRRLVDRVLFARVGRFDDYADGFLVETFEAAFALQVFEMSSDRAFAGEVLRLFVSDEPALAQLLQAFRPNDPAFAFRKSLFQERKSENGFNEFIQSCRVDDARSTFATKGLYRMGI